MSAMTVSAASEKSGKKPQYKDYVSFLGSYRSGRKDDQCSVTTNDSGVSFSLTNSSNNSSSSINSDLTDAPRNGFKDYLEHYNTKKFSSVQPAFIKKQKPDETKTVKTEVYIEIKDTPELNHVSKVVPIHPQVSTVSKVSKIFEQNGHSEEPVLVKSSGKVNTFKFEKKEPEIQNAIIKKTSIGEISKKFDTIQKQKPPLKKTPSISERSKLFEEINHVEPKKVITNNNTPKPYQPKEDANPPLTNGYTSPKPSLTNGSTSPKPPINNVRPILAHKAIVEACIQPQMKPQIIPSPPPPPPVQTYVISSSEIPCPPPLPFCTAPQLPASNIPPPPPPPPANFTPKSPPKQTVTCQRVVNNKPVQNGTKTDLVDGPVIDKNDPRVKRMVYGALREMYGAYHDKANDYIATLPRNRVKKNNGLDSIINSIA